MRSEKNNRVYLEQILDSIAKIKSFARGMDYGHFLDDQKTQSAVIMQLALIGELAKKISKTIKSKIDVPWKQIAGFRDRAIHDYYEIDLRIAWDTLTLDLEPLEQAVNDYLSK